MSPMRNVLAALLFLSAAGRIPAMSWSLPYPRPAAYDYSSYYNQDLRDFIAQNPNFLRDEFAKGWSYYKSTFIMSNGLVNHQRGASTGLNEAVSEGQGYGMLLALLNNDQATFNRIFTAANQYLWDNGRSSYFTWCWPGCGSGAATDADLDIGLALVFADMLQRNQLWTAYNQGGVTYQSRAMNIIRSLRQNMTDQDYLLPGDNWQGNGLDNQNVSYYATAAMKVFNSYQTEVGFAPVITRCYQVLKANTTQYNKGQAPDWCTRTGGQASFWPGSTPYSGYSTRHMANDGIRTPYRISLDALWYNSADAKEYCYNSRNTLTQYANTNINMLFGQMALYDGGTNMLVGTEGSSDYVAMWCCAIMGSRNTAYSSACMKQDMVARIIGPNSSNSFGYPALSDHLYYFKQSLAMLGFAVSMGLFPNVYEDLKNGVPVVNSGRSPGSGAGPRLSVRVNGAVIVLTHDGPAVAPRLLTLDGARVPCSVSWSSGQTTLVPAHAPAPGAYLLQAWSRGNEIRSVVRF